VSDYEKQVFDSLKASGIRAEFDDRNEKIGYKIRDWEMRKVAYMLIVGEKEKTNRTVSIRQHKKGDQGVVRMEEFQTRILENIKTRALTI